MYQPTQFGFELAVSRFESQAFVTGVNNGR